ncbi:ankyrin repeat domain-containing protein 49 [Oratosquilla oratoria]|uniref:ankyrin repeat domain-containing protein 49 n=1 Tax=Oratosquilla oratoria TaxID=337810 RepID=UPI003F764AE0
MNESEGILSLSEDSSDVEEDDPHIDSETEILWASEKGKESLVQSILAKNPHLVQTKDIDGYTPLHRAAYNNHPNVVKLLLEAKAPIDACTVDGWTPLHSACRWNNYQCATILIQAGGNINAQTNSGQSPLLISASYPQAGKTLQLLLSSPRLKPFNQNHSKESANVVAERSGPYRYLFDMVEPVLEVL